MDQMREGGSTTRPPILDGTNYAYWKTRMTAFIKSIDSKTWKAVVTSWEPPTSVVEGKTVQKAEIEWTEAEDQASLGNSRALNAIYNGVDPNVFKLINTCQFAEEAWRILEVAYEGTSKVKSSRLQLLYTRFESLKMLEKKKIADFNVRVLDIANESFALGEKISEKKLIQKVLRSLPRRFDMKVTAIEEAHEIESMKLDELFGSLRTFELSISSREEKKNKGIAFQSMTDEEMSEKEKESSENLNDSIDMLTKQFSKVVKNFRRPNPHSSNNRDQQPYRKKDLDRRNSRLDSLAVHLEKYCKMK